MEIRISGVSKIFKPDIVALEDIYITVRPGEFLYLVGPTGSGKSTLLRLITARPGRRAGRSPWAPSTSERWDGAPSVIIAATSAWSSRILSSCLT